jgi:hypothetical protein
MRDANHFVWMQGGGDLQFASLKGARKGGVDYIILQRDLISTRRSSLREEASYPGAIR